MRDEARLADLGVREDVKIQVPLLHMQLLTVLHQHTLALLHIKLCLLLELHAVHMYAIWHNGASTQGLSQVLAPASEKYRLFPDWLHHNYEAASCTQCGLLSRFER